MPAGRQIRSYHTHFRGQQISNEERNTKNRTDDGAIIMQFMNERNFPDWFRGMSQFQMNAADSLLNSIRDDSKQGTSHRVRDALIKLGIDPLVSRRRIKLAMRLSRGNDMAFLWFLMELYYRRACDECDHGMTGYTLNEQLIMSAIAHLDTIPTLRELDKLLPKQPLKPVVEKKRRKKIVKPAYILPYFEKQQRPVSYGKSLTLTGANSAAYFGDYERYTNPNYVVHNESNRWFAEYELNKGKRIAKRILDEQIEGIFEHEDAGTLWDDQRNPVLCGHHVTMEAMKRSMANELEVLRKKACEKYFDLEGRLKDQSYKRVMNQLNNEITKAKVYLEKFTNASRMRMKKSHPNLDGTQQASNRSIASRQTFYNEYFNKYDFEHAAASTAKSIFFQAPTCHKPYKFNYNKIFDLGPKNPIKDAVATALNAGSSCDMSIDHTRAVRHCCKDIWKTEVEKRNAEFAEKERARKKPSKKSDSQFDRSYYDPRDKDLMESMLLKAIQEMKRNKKFVLVSLPDAHKIPILREWIKKRYGMVYTRKEKEESYKMSKKVFRVLKKDEICVKIPELNDLASKRVVSYGCKEYLLRKTNYLKERYHHNFKVSLLEDTRIYWGAVRPYQCTKGPPRNEFFAYLPARENDVHMFRPWKVSEYIHAKEEWNRRQQKQRMDLLY